ncbi:YebC/PmpR family DNA-binding transcriptional regulator [Candidatus Saccharibacteria bacterium]|nr:YebC/PmpR family DNA-binding transcriptional regulator [Candidatus Saccharibacteria bacterium]
MAGHSKWAKIKRDKASNDAKRGAVFTKLGNQIAVAARAGTNPDTNNALALAIETAKSFNMPQSTISRAIQRAADKAAANVEEVLYEGYGPGGLAILVECATDNRKRTYPEVKSAFAKNGGNIAEPGSVAFNFKHCGEILLSGKDDDAMMQALEAGAEDVVEEEQGLSVITAPADLHAVLEKLKTAGAPVEHAGLIYKPKVVIDLDDKLAARAEKLTDILESLNDTINVYSNLANG